MLKKMLDSLNKESQKNEKVILENLGHTVSIKKETLNKLLKKGWWHILFIGEDKYSQYGLRIMPGKKWQDWPLVRMNDDYSCSTIGPNAASFLEFIQFKSIATNYSFLKYYKKNWENYYKIAAPLSKILGSKDDLQTFKKFIFKPIKNIENLDKKGMDNLYVNFWNLYAMSKEHTQLRKLIEKMIADDDFVPDITSSLNNTIWQTRLSHLLMSRITIDYLEANKTDPKLLTTIFDEPHFCDVEETSIFQQSNPISPPCRCVFDYTEVIITSDMIDKINDIQKNVMLAIYKKGREKYTGIQHAEVAALLDDQLNEPIRSWNALVNSAYWSGQNLKEAMFPTWEAAIELAKEYKWKDVQFALEYQMKLFKK